MIVIIRDPQGGQNDLIYYDDYELPPSAPPELLPEMVELSASSADDDDEIPW